MHDLVVRGGTVVDGSGAPRFKADVAIKSGKIVAVGSDVGPGKHEIDAGGKLVTPGWVDMHTHYDGQVTWDSTLSPSGWHGVTTVVMGNCGVGFAPCKAEDRDWLIDIMEGVEDIPGSALSEGIKWEWESFPEYLDALERLPMVLDVGTQVPHAPVRGFVMGREASESDRAATPDEVAQMKSIVAEALHAGALGFSTSRTCLHKTASGNFVAGTFAAVQELMGIGSALKEVGHGVFELADEHVRVLEDLGWLERLATETGQPVLFSLSQTDFAPELWRDVLAGLEAAAGRGSPLFAQVAGRAIGILMNWRGTAHPFALHPSWQALSTLPWEEQLAQLRTPEVRARILGDTPLEVGVFEAYVTRTFDKMYAMGSSADYEPSPEDSLAARAAADGRNPAEVAYDLMLQDEGRGFLYFPLFNYSDKNLDLLHKLHNHPQTRMGLSDGGAHCGAICDGGMPTFMLTHWARDRARGPRISLERIIHRQTRQTAELYGLHDRGLLAPGYKADLNVIDYERLSLDLPRLVFDLPAGGRRLIQKAAGYEVTVCGGVVTFEHGEHTGAHPGSLIRGEQAAPKVASTATRRAG